MKTALTIAGSDPSGGAGIQADIKTMTANGVYAMSAVTALTAQNTTGIYGIMEVTPEFLRSQLDCIFLDIVPDAVKIGMLFSEDMVRTVAQRLRKYEAKHIVLDPVMASTSGSGLMKKEALFVMQEELFPLAELITPNIPEAEVLTGLQIRGTQDMERAASVLYERWHVAVLCKGGHGSGDADDLLFLEGKAEWIRGKRIDNSNTHGTGCTLSSAVAANLAKQYELKEAVTEAKNYLSHVLSAGLNLGKGTGPMNHAYIFHSLAPGRLDAGNLTHNRKEREK